MPGDVVPDDVCVVGSLNVDLVVRVARHPAPGETVMGTTVETFLGGKGYNQAVAAARAGARTSIVGAVGEDGYGDDVLAALAADGIDAGGVRRVAGGTGMAFPVVDDAGQNTIIVVPRANHDVEVTDVERMRDVVGTARVVLLQLELRPAVVAAAAAIARRGGALVVLNPAPVVGDATRFAGLVDVVVPNESELALLTATDGSDPAAAAAVLAEATGASAVVVTLGERGALLWTPAAVTAVPLPRRVGRRHRRSRRRVLRDARRPPGCGGGAARCRAPRHRRRSPGHDPRRRRAVDADDRRGRAAAGRVTPGGTEARPDRDHTGGRHRR